jgi:hypothetical protein
MQWGVIAVFSPAFGNPIITRKKFLQPLQFSFVLTLKNYGDIYPYNPDPQDAATGHMHDGHPIHTRHAEQPAHE